MANYLLVLTHGHNCQREGPARRLLLLWHVRMPWPAPKLGAGIRVRSDVLPCTFANRDVGMEASLSMHHVGLVDVGPHVLHRSAAGPRRSARAA